MSRERSPLIVVLDGTYQLVVKPLGKPRRSWEGSFEMNLRDIGWGGMG
jgi:hypothetical protein